MKYAEDLAEIISSWSQPIPMRGVQQLPTRCQLLLLKNRPYLVHAPVGTRNIIAAFARG